LLIDRVYAATGDSAVPKLRTSGFAAVGDPRNKHIGVAPGSRAYLLALRLPGLDRNRVRCALSCRSLGSHP
jgi:hypothetical protein